MKAEIHNRTISEILAHEAEAIRTIPADNDYKAAIDLIVRQVHGSNGRLITSGMGKAGQIAANIATTFSSTGTPAYFLHPSEAQHGDLGLVRSGDIMLLISNSGRTREVLELVELTKRLVPEIHPHYRPPREPACGGGGCLPGHRQSGRSMSFGNDSDYQYDGDDGDRRCSGRRYDAGDRLRL